MTKMAKQDGIETIDEESSLDGYGQLLKNIKSILQQGLSKAYKAVDNLEVQTYWQYARAKREGKLTITLPMHVEPTIPEKVFKDAYNFDFLGLKENHTEANLVYA